MGRIVVLAVIAISLLSCGADNDRSEIDLLSYYADRDTLGLCQLVHDDHHLLRGSFNSLLDSLLYCKARSEVRADSLTDALEWLRDVYSTESGCPDKKGLFELYDALAPYEARIKLALDSALDRAMRDFGAKTSSEQGPELATHLSRLRDIFRDYETLADSFSLASVNFYIARAFFDLNHPDSSLTYFSRSYEISDSIGYIDLAADCQLYIGLVLNVQKADYLQAQKALLTAEQLYHKTDNSDRLQYLATSRLHILQQLFQTEEVIKRLQGVLQDVQETGNSQLEGYYLYLLGESYYDLGLLDSALYFTTKSREVRVKPARADPSAEIDLGFSESLLGLIAQENGQWGDALEKYRAADEIFREHADASGINLNNLRLASLYVLQKQFAQARKLYQTVLSEATQFEEIVQAAYGIAITEYYLGDIEKATSQLYLCIGYIETTRQKLPIPDMKTGMLSDKIGVYHLLACIYIDRYRQSDRKEYLDSAFQALERGKSKVLVDNLGSTHDAGPTSAESELLARLSDVERSLLVAANDSLIQYRLVLEDSLAAWRIRNTPVTETAFTPSGAAVSAPAKEVRQALDDDDLLIEYLLSEFGVYLFVVTSDSIEVVPLQSSLPILESTIIDHVESINHYPLASDTLAVWEETGRRLYEMLIPDDILSRIDARDLIVVPSGKLHYLPFATLRTPDDRFLIERCEISYVPSSLTLCLLNSRNSVNRDRRRIVAFGDPTYNGSIADPLPFSGQEVAAIAGLFGEAQVEPYLREAASVSQFKQTDFSEAQFVHIAAHGIANRRQPGRSGLLLAGTDSAGRPELLSAREIARMDIPVDQVFLSSCESGAGKSYPGEGVVSLAQPFFTAGCNSVVVTCWNVDDRSSVDFVKTVYGNLKNGYGKSVSLAAAQRDLLHSRYNHPYFWASFVLMGLVE